MRVEVRAVALVVVVLVGVAVAAVAVAEATGAGAAATEAMEEAQVAAVVTVQRCSQRGCSSPSIGHRPHRHTDGC